MKRKPRKEKPLIERLYLAAKDLADSCWGDYEGTYYSEGAWDKLREVLGEYTHLKLQAARGAKL